MTTVSDPLETPLPDDTRDDRPPPLLAVGPLAWIRENLFRTWFDTLLTVVSVWLIANVVTGLVNWLVGEANWFAISFNLRLFLLGRFPADAEWRVQLLALLVALTTGLCLAAWARLSRRVIIALVVIVALAFIVPPLIAAAVPPAPAYFAAGAGDLTAGTETQRPQPNLGFIGRAGETVTVEAAGAETADDRALADLAGFVDQASNVLRNAAGTRLTSMARIAEIDALLAGDLLTGGQRDLLTAEREKLTVADPVTETYAVNRGPVVVRILRGTTLEPLAEAQLAAGGEALTVTLPEDGWYVLEKTVEGEGAALLRTRGISPLLERSFAQAGGGPAGRISQYVRITDSFTTEELRPVIEDDNVPMVQVIDNQYRGTRPLADYLSLFLGPFIDQTNEALLLLVVALFLGYGVGQALNRVSATVTTPDKIARPRWLTQRAATWSLIVLPVLMFLLVYGFGAVLPQTNTSLWGGLLLTVMLTVVGIIGSFPIGVLLALGRRSHLPAVSLLSTMYIEFVRGVPLITVLFMAQLLVPLVNPSLAEVDSVFRAMVGIVLFSAAYLAENVRGGLQAIPHGQEEAARALGLSGLQITLHITLPQALRAVIPALVGQFISLFKDTSLVAIVGLLDLSGIARNVISQTEFLGLRREVFVFITILYFVFSYAMATISRRIEASGAGRTRAQQI